MAAPAVVLKCPITVKSYLPIFSKKHNYNSYLLKSKLRYFSCKKGFLSKDKYDIIVIGGGSGGLSCAKEAKALGADVCVLDFVTPSPRGTTWGLGGTCVNVGCIPKKLMHQAALIGEAIHEAGAYGWSLQNSRSVALDWEILKGAVQDHIKSINWVTRVGLRENKIEYINGMGKFVDNHTIKVVTKEGDRLLHGDNIVIAVGGRPRYPNIPGAIDYGISSDDIFNLSKPPGKTLIVGAGYIALEFAGFLNAFKYSVTVMVRSLVLRSFDRQMANFVTQNMIEKGIKFIHKTVPQKIEKSGERLLVTYENIETKEIEKEDFDNVLFAIGRRILTEELNIKAVNIETDPDTGKIITKNERTNIPHVYAIGDVIYGKPELTPVAVAAGKLLARQIFKKSDVLMNYDTIATAIFAPLEYGCVGLSEEKALEKFGEDQIEVYHSFYKPIEFTVPQKSIAQCYLKVICLRNSPNKVLGMHFVGPTAGEVIQGYAVAMQCGLTMDQLTNTIGVHPTVSEEFTRLTITKRSGLDPTPPACCS